MKTVFAAIVLSLLVVGVFTPFAHAEEVTPLLNAHAHNDYEHDRPLLDALALGFCSIEVDVWHVDGELLVAHDLKDTNPEKTIERLYLDPLMERVTQNGGRVYPDGPEIILLVDLKNRGKVSYPVLVKKLKNYKSMLTIYSERKGVEHRAVQVIVTGGTPKAMMLEEKVHYAGIDGRIRDLISGVSPHVMPLISASWTGRFPSESKAPLHEDIHYDIEGLVEAAHDHGYKFRFWATPENAGLWDELRDLNVDLINTDELEKLSDFLRAE